MTVNTNYLVARCPQETGVGVPFDIFTGTRFFDAMIPLVKGMTG